MPCSEPADFTASYAGTKSERYRCCAVTIYGECVHEGGSASYSNDLENHYDAVRYFLRFLCHDTDIAEDLAQETYLRAYLHLSRHGRRIERPRQWLYKIARCAYVDHVRYESVRPKINEEMVEGIADARAERPPMAAEVRERIDELSQEIGRLDPLSRDLLVDFHIDGQCFAHLAARYGVSETMARVRVFRARRLLRRKCR